MPTTLITEGILRSLSIRFLKSPRVHNLSFTHLTIIKLLNPPGPPCSCHGAPVSSKPALRPRWDRPNSHAMRPPRIPTPLDACLARALELNRRSTLTRRHRAPHMAARYHVTVPCVLPPRHPRFNVRTHIIPLVVSCPEPPPPARISDTWERVEHSKMGPGGQQLTKTKIVQHKACFYQFGF